jgi:hypothetical protein
MTGSLNSYADFSAARQGPDLHMNHATGSNVCVYFKK